MITAALPPDLEQFVQREVSSGAYGSADELICEALRLLQRLENERRVARLRREIGPALERLNRGEGLVVSQDELRAFFDDLIAEADQETAVQQGDA